MFITPEYLALQKQLHKDSEVYGVSGLRYIEIARTLSKYGRLDILDYGAGKRTLSLMLGPAYRVTDYDPCVPGIDAPPSPHDVVMCTDVMEHIEPQFIDGVLADIRRLTKKVAFFSISVVEAQKTLADGRNAHISIHPRQWWLERIASVGFEIGQLFDDEDGCNTFGAICR